jgi:hypothetical protein
MTVTDKNAYADGLCDRALGSRLVPAPVVYDRFLGRAGNRRTLRCAVAPPQDTLLPWTSSHNRGGAHR